MIDFLYRVVRPLLFRLDPEEAHELTFSMLPFARWLAEIAQLRPDPKLACKVGPLTFAGLTGRPVHTDNFAPGAAMAHIQLAKWADIVAIAPLSANTLGKIACGLADDLLTTTLLALPRGTRCLLAPAMNTEMWFKPVVQRNIRWIDEMERFSWIAPTEKRLACGDHGVGGLAEPADILAALEAP